MGALACTSCGEANGELELRCRVCGNALATNSYVTPHAERPVVAEPALPTVERRHYDIEGEHARGGIGRVLRAQDRRLGRPVALKELQRTDGEAAARFFREAAITARLQHPGVVPVYEAGR